MAIAIYTDKDSGQRAVCDALRSQGISVLRSEDAGNDRYPDPLQLEFAAARGLAVLTANHGDFAALHRHWRELGRHHAGIIIRVNQRMPVGRQIQALLAIDRHLGAIGLSDQLVYLDNWVEYD